MRNFQEMDIDELVTLLGIPQVKEAVFYKINEFKEHRGHLIDSYKKEREMFRRTVFESVRRDESDTEDSGNNALYYYEIVRFRPGDIRVVGFEPEIPPYYNRSELLPEDVIERLFDAPGDFRDARVLWKEPSHLYGKQYDLQFIRWNESHVTGTIRENNETREERYRNQVHTVNEGLDAAYHVLFHHMQRYPEIRDYIFNEFFGKIKPVLDDREQKEKMFEK